LQGRPTVCEYAPLFKFSFKRGLILLEEIEIWLIYK
jgi:hypothetical protein